jgi:hypothetical protein
VASGHTASVMQAAAAATSANDVTCFNYSGAGTSQNPEQDTARWSQ